MATPASSTPERPIVATDVANASRAATRANTKRYVAALTTPVPTTVISNAGTNASPPCETRS